MCPYFKLQFKRNILFFFFRKSLNPQHSYMVYLFGLFLIIINFTMINTKSLINLPFRMFMGLLKKMMKLIYFFL